MKFLVDVHLPISLSKFLNAQTDCNSTHVNQILNKWNTSDTDIANYADEYDLVVLTKDSDFVTSHLINETPKKLIRIVLGNIANKDLLSTMERFLPSILSLSANDEFYIELSREQLIVIT